jgi:hypothetical protein
VVEVFLGVKVLDGSRGFGAVVLLIGVLVFMVNVLDPQIVVTRVQNLTFGLRLLVMADVQVHCPWVVVLVRLIAEKVVQRNVQEFVNIDFLLVPIILVEILQLSFSITKKRLPTNRICLTFFPTPKIRSSTAKI